MTLRAVHILRPDAQSRFGGDVVHLEAMVSGLRDHGIDAVATTWDQAPERVDVVHLWNLDLPFALRRHARDARTRWPGASVVLTPIFWPWSPSLLVRSRDPAILRRAARNAAKAWLSWPSVRRALKDVDAVLACSERELDLLSRYYRLRRSRAWAVATTAVHVDEWPVRNDDIDRVELAASMGFDGVPGSIVACAGRLEPLKNQRTLVHAVAQLRDTGLVLVGAAQDPGYAASVVELGHRLLPGRFAWLDRRPHDEVRHLLASVDVHALVSYREVASLSSLEAAAAGCEVVVSRWSSAKEYFGDAAHHCDAASPRDVARAIQAAQQRPTQPALRELVEERFDWSIPVRAAAALYAEVRAA